MRPQTSGRALLACENGPIKWVAQHRMHHANSDTEKDPHSAAKGFLWSHMLWMLYYHSEFDDKEKIRNYSKDIADDMVSAARYEQLLEALMRKQQEIEIEIKPTCAPQFGQ